MTIWAGKPHLQRITSHTARRLPVGNCRQSAILIPFLKHKKLELVFTQRSDDLKNHAGQISFPGGGIEENESGWQAALREAEEEIGMSPEKVELIGRLDDLVTHHGFHIQVYAGLCHHFEPRLNHREVSRLVEVGFRELFDDAIHETKTWRQRSVHYFNFKQGLVWGITGHITYNLRQTMLGQRQFLSLPKA